MSFELHLIDHVCGEDYTSPCYAVIGKNYDTKKQAGNAKKSYSAARGGVVKEAKKLAERCGLRSPWKIVER